MTALCAEALQPNIAPIIANACVIDNVSGCAAVSAKDVMKNALTRISRNSAPQLFCSGGELMVFHCGCVLSFNETQAQPRLRGTQVATFIGTLATLDIQKTTPSEPLAAAPG